MNFHVLLLIAMASYWYLSVSTKFFSNTLGIGANNDDKDTKEDTTSTETEDSIEETTDDTEDTSSNDTKGEDSTEDDEDITKQYFTDPESLDPKLRGAFKKMQGVFTKKMQEAALGVKKAQAFDQLVLDPEFREWMEARRNGNAGKKESRKSSDNDDTDDDDDDDTPMTRKALRAELQNMFKGIEQKASKEEQAAAMREEAKAFKAANPDWEIYKTEILEIIERHPTLTYQEAYDLAAREDNKKMSKKQTIEEKKKANVNKPGKVVGKTPEKKGKMTVEEAFNAAKKKLGL